MANCEYLYNEYDQEVVKIAGESKIVICRNVPEFKYFKKIPKIYTGFVIITGNDTLEPPNYTLIGYFKDKPVFAKLTYLMVTCGVEMESKND